MKKIIALLLFFYVSCVHSQDVNSIIANLKKQLNEASDAKQTAIIYSDLTWYYSNVSLDSALHYGAKAIVESKKLGDSTLQAQVFSDLGAVYFRKGDFANSEDNYLKAYRIRKAQKDFKGLAKINNNLANVYLNQQKNPLAMKRFIDALAYFESVKDEQNSSVAKSNIGLLYIELSNYPKAISYLKEAVKYAEKNKLTDRLCEFYLNLGNAYKESNDTVNSYFYYDKSLKNCKAVGNVKAGSIIYQNIAIMKLKQKKLHEAKILLDESKKNSTQFNSSLDMANLQLSVARTQIKSKQFVEAQKTLLRIKKIFEKENSDEDLLITYKLLVPVYAYLNQPDSVAFYNEKYATLNDLRIESKVAKQTSELEAKYQTAKKEKLLLKKEDEVQKKNNLLFTVSSLTLFIVVLSLLIYRQQKLKNKQQQQEFELKSAIAQIETQNKLQEQRLTISRDLHDNIGAQLTFIISSVDNIKQGFDIQNAKLNHKLKYISDFTKSTIVELRDTIWAMNNNEIDFEDLRARILNFTEKAQFAKEHIDFKFIIDETLNDEKLTSIAGMNIYRTIQEAVNNAIKYADADSIIIDAKRVGDQIEIVVSDNGIGFDIATTEAGNGLLNMEKRIEDIQGIFTIKSKVSEGTTIRIILDQNSLNR